MFSFRRHLRGSGTAVEKPTLDATRGFALELQRRFVFVALIFLPNGKHTEKSGDRGDGETRPLQTRNMVRHHIA